MIYLFALLIGAAPPAKLSIPRRVASKVHIVIHESFTVTLKALVIVAALLGGALWSIGFRRRRGTVDLTIWFGVLVQWFWNLGVMIDGFRFVMT